MKNKIILGDTGHYIERYEELELEGEMYQVRYHSDGTRYINYNTPHHLPPGAKQCKENGSVQK